MIALFSDISTHQQFDWFGVNVHHLSPAANCLVVNPTQVWPQVLFLDYYNKAGSFLSAKRTSESKVKLTFNKHSRFDPV
jgi:hypothetical protein